MKKIIALILFVISCSIPSNGVLENNEEQFLSWRGEDFPLDVVISENVSDDNRSTVMDSIQEWNMAARSDVFAFREDIPWDSTELLTRRRATIYVSSLDLPDTGAPDSTQAETILHWRRTTITDATLTLDVALSRNDARLVVLHELGHCLGLSHDTWRPSVMYRYAPQSGGRIMDDDLNFVRFQMNNW